MYHFEQRVSGVSGLHSQVNSLRAQGALTTPQSAALDRGLDGIEALQAGGNFQQVPSAWSALSDTVGSLGLPAAVASPLQQAMSYAADLQTPSPTISPLNPISTAEGSTASARFTATNADPTKVLTFSLAPDAPLGAHRSCDWHHHVDAGRQWNRQDRSAGTRLRFLVLERLADNRN